MLLSLMLSKYNILKKINKNYKSILLVFKIFKLSYKLINILFDSIFDLNSYNIASSILWGTNNANVPPVPINTVWPAQAQGGQAANISTEMLVAGGLIIGVYLFLRYMGDSIGHLEDPGVGQMNTSGTMEPVLSILIRTTVNIILISAKSFNKKEISAIAEVKDTEAESDGVEEEWE